MKANNPFYKTKRWKKKRESVLRRDGYMCRECKRYGRTCAATTVHHIMPLELYPQYKYLSTNLYSVCNKCHESFHNRLTNELTLAGKQLFDRFKQIIERSATDIFGKPI